MGTGQTPPRRPSLKSETPPDQGNRLDFDITKEDAAQLQRVVRLRIFRTKSIAVGANLDVKTVNRIYNDLALRTRPRTWAKLRIWFRTVKAQLP